MAFWWEENAFFRREQLSEPLVYIRLLQLQDWNTVQVVNPREITVNYPRDMSTVRFHTSALEKPTLFAQIAMPNYVPLNVAIPISGPRHNDFRWVG
jgi:hypothetical protein